MMPESLTNRLERELHARPVRIVPLSGGCVGEVYAVTMADGTRMVAKVDASPRPSLDIEGYMLTYLAENSELPVPTVLFVEPALLVMSYVAGENRFPPTVERHAAQLLASLHGISGPSFGLGRDTLIGGLHQPNDLAGSWIPFFQEHRLLYMAAEASRAGRLPTTLLKRLERFAGALHRWLSEPACPGLIHGDIWTGNVLAAGELIRAFIDPAIYYADPEIELAFITLFGTFGQSFFSHYETLRPIAPGFFEERSKIYNLYPLLVHVRLFGGSYVRSVEQTLKAFGY